MQRQVDELVAVGEQEFVGSGSGRVSHRLSQAHGAIALACVLAGVRSASSFECAAGQSWAARSGAPLTRVHM